MKHVFLFLILILLSVQAISQNSPGSIEGKVTDYETQEALLFATVTIYKANQETPIKGVETDLDGNYSISNLDSGKYDLQFSYTGYSPLKVTGITVYSGEVVRKDVSLTSGVDLQEVVVTVYVEPLIRQDNTTQGKKITGKDIASLPANRNSRNRTKRRSSRSNKSNRVVSQKPVSSNESYKTINGNTFKLAKDNPLSTFSVDVDRASYSNVRRFINDGTLPPVDAVRIEEMINYFQYNYPKNTTQHPVAIHTEYADCPWNEKHQLLKVSLNTKKLAKENTPPNNLVFLLDVSGSMNSYDKLPLLKSTFKLLVNQLRAEDKVSIVVYAGAAGLVLEPTSDKIKILNALNSLEAGGSTAGGRGIQLAYKIAQEQFIKNGNNRVILATDGDFNVGMSSDADMERLIETKRNSGIYLTCLGFGTGNFKDSKMEVLADKGNGNYSYIDSEQEAKKVFEKELVGTLLTVAKDVKFQLEFNTQNVAAYRLIGYENRLLNDEDFDNDAKDAGEIGAGHQVTALYEIIPAGVKSQFLQKSIALKYKKQKEVKRYSDELLTIKLRYKPVDKNKSKLIEYVVKNKPTEASNDFQFASSVALFGMILRQSEFTNDYTFDNVIRLAEHGLDNDKNGYRQEFIELVGKASELANPTVPELEADDK